MSANKSSDGSVWTREEELIINHAIANYYEDLPDRWDRFAAELPGKSIAEIKLYLANLVEDVDLIESDRVAIPFFRRSSIVSKPSKDQQERRKGIPWTEEEHRLVIFHLVF